MDYILRTLIFLILGITFANIAVEMGLSRYLSRIVWPLINFSHLSKEISSGIIARLLSPAVGYSTLSELYRKKKIREDEVILATFITTFPYEFTRMASYYIPIVIPFLGISLGLKYLGIKVAAAFFQTLLGILYGHFIFPSTNYEFRMPSGKGDIKGAVNSSLKTLKRVIPIFLVAMVFIRLLNESGLLESFSKIAYPLTGFLGLPGESAIIIVSQVANMIGGYAVASQMLESGLIDEDLLLVTLVLGLIISLPRIYLQHTLPMVSSLFNKRMAFKIIGLKIIVEGAILLVFVALLI